MGQVSQDFVHMDVFLFSSCDFTSTLIYASFANLAKSILEYSSLLSSGVSFSQVVVYVK